MTIAYNMDCMEAMAQMKDNEFDLAIVDPPYGIGLDMIFNGAHGKKQRNKEKKNWYIHERKDWNNLIPDEKYFIELHRISKNQIIWGCNYYAKFIPAVGRIIHDKEMGIEGTKINFSHADIASCSMQKRITMFRYRWSGNKQGRTINWENNGLDGRIHPTQKPIALYKWLLKNYAKEGDRILDTHLGSGSSRIAAHDMGFDFAGYEIDKDYFEAQEKRFANHIKQQSLFKPNEMY